MSRETQMFRSPTRLRLFVVAALLATVAPMSGLTMGPAAAALALPAGARDISDTATGKAIIEQAVTRNPRLRDAGRLRAVKDDEGTTVAPADTEFVAY